jgi:hypothetical protein
MTALPTEAELNPPWPKVTPVLAALAQLIRSAPDVAGARCRGEAPLFDSQLPGERLADTAERHRQARRLCASCPAWEACSAAASALGIAARGSVWAGVTR